jgi:hypothetical protein
MQQLPPADSHAQTTPPKPSATQATAQPATTKTQPATTAQTPSTGKPVTLVGKPTTTTPATKPSTTAAAKPAPKPKPATKPKTPTDAVPMDDKASADLGLRDTLTAADR